MPIIRGRVCQTPARAARAALVGAVVLVCLPPAIPHLVAQDKRFALGKAVVIGGATDLTRVSNMALGPGSLIAVAQPQDRSVLLFDRTRPDKPIAKVGRMGEGPGEFGSVGSIGWIGDTLWVADGDRPRIELFSRSGKHITSRTFTPPVAPIPARYIGPFLLLREGSVVYYPGIVGALRPAAPETENPRFPILLAHGRVPTLDTVSQFRALEGILTMRGDKGGSVASQPFSVREIVRSGANGSRLLVVAEPTGKAPDARLSVTVIGPRGQRLVNKQLPLLRVAVTDAEWDSVVTRRSTLYAEDVWSSEAKARAALQSLLVRPPFHPMASAAFVGQDGSIWLRQGKQNQVDATWVILTPSGEMRGTVAVPASLRITDGTATSVATALADSDGVDHVSWIPLVSRP